MSERIRPGESKLIERESLRKIRFFIFDFDGVFTSGRKGEGFNERDSMGLNMLRFGYYLATGSIPKVAIVTGENNQIAIDFAQREHFNYIFLGLKDKKQIFEVLSEEKALSETCGIAIVYDDINDLSLAGKAGMRFLVSQPGSEIFGRLLRVNGFCDYQTRTQGGNGAVREICELILDQLGSFKECVDCRTDFSESYQNYWALRQSINTKIFRSE